MTGLRPIEVSYRPQLKDVLHAARVAEGETWKTASRVTAAILCLCGVWFVFWGFPRWAVLWFGLAVAEWFNLLPLSVLVAYLEFKRNPKYRQQYDLILSPEGLSFRTDTVSSELKWEHYSRFGETKTAFVLSYGPGVPTVIPKAAFVEQTDCEAARTLLKEVVGRRHARQGRS